MNRIRRLVSLLAAASAALMMISVCRSAEPAIPVTLDEKVVFSVGAPLGPFTAQERAASAQKRLLRLAQDPFYDPELFTVEETEHATQLRYGHTTIGFITDQDAAVVGVGRTELAAESIETLKTAISEYQDRRRPEARRRGWIAVAAAAIAFAGFAALVGWIYRRLVRRLERRQWIGVTRFLRKYLSIPDDRIVATERTVLKIFRLLATVIGALVCLQIAFTFYPLTRGYALTLLAFVVDPLTSLWHGFLSSISDLVAAAVLIVLVFYGLKLLRWVFTAVADGTVELPGIAREWALPMYKLVRIVVIALAVVMVFPYIPGSSTQAFKGVSLFAGALFTLGATGTIGNFIGGLVAMFVGAFRLGDVVKIGDVVGVVTEMTLVLTRIRTPKQEIVTVPNAAILTTQITNYSAQARENGVILHTAVTIGYDAPWRTVEGLLLDAASRTPLVETTPAPFVLQTALNDFFITYEINVYTREPIQTPVIYSMLHQNIQDAFNAAGVEIMSPHFAALRDGNTTAIPEASRKGAESRKFEVRAEKSEG
jgi:small-conductance mechanosensitive channel